MKKPFLIIILSMVGILLLTAACSAGFVAGRTLTQAVASPPPTITETLQDLSLPDLESPEPPVVETAPRAGEPLQTGNPQDIEELFQPFWETWEILHDQYVDQPLDEEALMRGAISGMLESLGDEHTSYMDPNQFQQANIPLEGEYEGIGAWVDPDAEFLTIVSPMPGSPAEAAGLVPGDKIIAVDGEDMTGIDGNLVIRRVLGPAGSDVVLTILREESAEPFDVTITRAKITIPSVDSRMLDNNIAYLQLITFGDTTTHDLREALTELLAQNPDGLILDLRNNGGGYLTTAIEVASEFVPDGVVMFEQFGDGTREEFFSNGRGIATEIPLVVLVNEGTASASEIVAGAIQDYGRGALVGVTTFGKGSVQQWIPLNNEEGAVRVTVARWLTPNERQIHEIGLEPDYVVEMPVPDEDPAETPEVESGEDQPDPQLDKAIEILLGNQ